MRLLAFSLLLAGAHGFRAAAPRGPFTKIVNLLNHLTVELQSEHDNEKKIFDKWLCWAQKLQGKCENIVADADQQINELQAKVAKDEAQKGALLQEVAEHQIDAERAQAAIENAKSLREQENAKFMVEQSEHSDCVNKCQEALQALAKVGTNGAANVGIGELGYETGAFLQAHTEIANKLKSLKIKERNLSPDQIDALDSFLQGKTSNASLEQVAGMLRSIEDQCATSLSAARNEEEARQTSYVQVFEANSKLLAASTESANTKNSRAANKLQSATDTANTLAEIEEEQRQAQLQIQMLQKDIPTRKTLQEKRNEAIKDEIRAIQEAINFLGEARSISVSFLEVSSKIRDEKKEAARKEAADKLSEISKQDSNVAMIALQVKSGGTAFDKVIKMVDDMISNIEKDQKEAKAHFEYCEQSTADLAAAQDKLANDGKVLEATIEKEKAIQEDLGAQLRAEQDQIRNNGIAAKDASEQRQAENAEFKAQEDAALKQRDLLNRAIEVLEAYYSTVQGAGEGAEGSVSTATGGFSFVQISEHANPLGSAYGPYGPSDTTYASTLAPLPSDMTISIAGGPSNMGEDEPRGIANKQWAGSKKGRSAVSLLQDAINENEKESQARRNDENECQAEYQALQQRLDESTEAAREAICEINLQLARSQQDMVKAETDQGMWKRDTEINRATRLVNDKECTDLLQTYMQRSAVRKQEVEALNSVRAVLRNYNNQ